MSDNKRLQGRIALVTGASRGIGEAVAKRFAAEGAHVIAVARTQSALERLDDAIHDAGGTVTLVPLDLRDFDQIDHLGGVIAERWGKLDILVGNAGILGTLSPVGHIKPKVWQEVMDVNVTANYRLIRSFDALLRASDAGRAMFVTSGVAQSAAPAYWGAYATSKSALEMLVKTYAAEMEKTNVKVNMVDPGVVRTHMRKEAFPGEDATQHPLPSAITDRFVELALPTTQENGEICHVKIAA